MRCRASSPHEPAELDEDGRKWADSDRGEDSWLDGSYEGDDEAYQIARELAPHEWLPSPTWEVMCAELGWPV